MTTLKWHPSTTVVFLKVSNVCVVRSVFRPQPPVPKQQMNTGLVDELSRFARVLVRGPIEGPGSQPTNTVLCQSLKMGLITEGQKCCCQSVDLNNMKLL